MLCEVTVPLPHHHMQLAERSLSDLTVEQLMHSLCEAAAHRVQAQGIEQARLLLAEVAQAKAVLRGRASITALVTSC